MPSCAPVSVCFERPDLPGDRVVHGDDGELGSGQAERAALHAVVKGGCVVSPEDAGGEGGVEAREGRGDLGFEDCRVVDRLQGAGTQGAGDARARPRIERGWLEAADRDALGTEGDHAHDLGVIETDPDRLLERHRPDFLCLGVVRRPGLGQPRKLKRHRGGKEIGSLDLLVLERDSPEIVMRDRLGLIEVGKSLTTG